MSWIQTYCGVRFDLLRPRPEDIKPLDIAFSLSNICRFNGHAREFYSVAQHSLIVADLVDAQLERFAMLHDAAEAYTGDLVRPLKGILGDAFRDIEGRIQSAIDERFGLKWTIGIKQAIKQADDIALATERRDLFLSVLPWEHTLPPASESRIVPWNSAVARRAFEERLAPLCAEQPNPNRR